MSTITLITRFFLPDHKTPYFYCNFSWLKEAQKVFHNPPEIICISETTCRLKANVIKILSIPDCTFYHSSAVVTNADRVAVYIPNKFHFETTQEYNIENANCENYWMKLHHLRNKANYDVGVACRLLPPSRLSRSRLSLITKLQN